MHVKQQTFAYSEDMTRSLNKANNGHIAGCKQWIKLTSPFDNTLSTPSSLPTLSSQTAGVFLNNKSSAWESYQSTMLPQVPFSNLEDYACRICAAPLLHYLHLPHSKILQWLTKAETPSPKTMSWWTKKTPAIATQRYVWGAFSKRKRILKENHKGKKKCKNKKDIKRDKKIILFLKR